MTKPIHPTDTASTLSRIRASSEQDHTRQCATRINLYWARHGYDAQAEAVVIGSDEIRRMNMWGIRSNLKNGLPRRAK